MTVAELVARLQAMPDQQVEAKVSAPDRGTWSIDSVMRVAQSWDPTAATYVPIVDIDAGPAF